MESRLSALRVWVLPVDAEERAADQPNLQIPEDRQHDAGALPSVAFPATFGVSKRSADNFRLVVEGYVADLDTPVVRQTLVTSFRDGQRGLVKILLSDVCYQVVCAGLERTCRNVDGDCVPTPEVPFTPDDAPDAGPAPTVDVTAVDSECETGAHDCGATGERPRLCVGERWQVQEPCGRDETCSDGACRGAPPCSGAGCMDGDAGPRPDAAPNDATPPGNDADPLDGSPTAQCPVPDPCVNGRCSTTASAYVCSCDDGFANPSGDAHSCENVDECASGAPPRCRGDRGLPGTEYQFACDDRSPSPVAPLQYACQGQLADWDPRDGALPPAQRFETRTYGVGGRVALVPRSLDNVVFDRMTGLEWQESLSDGGPIGYANALSHCRAVSRAGGGFRMPSYVELLGLMDDTGQSHPIPPATVSDAVAFDETILPGPHDAWYWAEGTSMARSGAAAQGFFVAQVTSIGKLYADETEYAPTNGMHVRCVRPAPP